MFAMRLVQACIVVATVACAGAGAAAAPIVPGFERFGRAATGQAETIEAGLLLLGELGCVNCHAAGAAAAHLLPKQGPILSKVGERLKPEWIAEYLKNPQAVKPGTTMPHAIVGLDAVSRDRTAMALAHFLASTGPFDSGPLPESDKANTREGQGIYERSGCAVCHGSRVKNAVLLPDQMPLVDIHEKWSPRALDEFLKDPLAVRPSSRMPALPLKDGDRRHLVASLLGAVPPPHDEHRDHIAFQGKAWDVAVQKLPVIESLGAPTQSGPVTGFDVVALAGQSDNFVVQLQGFLHARIAGKYRLYLSSDDGSRLFIDNTLVVENDGVHPDSQGQGEIVLKAGVYPIRIDFFEASGGESLNLDIMAPGRSRVSVLEYVTPTANAKPLVAIAGDGVEGKFAIEPVLVEKGRGAFATVGCANCHELSGPDGRRIEPATRPKPLAELVAMDAGCLAAVGALPGVPHYSLDSMQQAALAAALGWLRSPAATAPPRERTVDRTLTALNCYACHSRDGRGGIIPAVAQVDEDGEPILKDAARDGLFTSAVQELGDEGRLPPTLTDIGDKLTPEFLVDVLRQGGKDRSATMHTLMPKWQPAAVDPLAKLLGEDAKTQVQTPPLVGHAAIEIDEQGRGLVGSKVLGCIKCHSFAGEKGQGVGVIDMTRMPQRLRHEWFLAYMANPQQFRPGTRMPAAWPEGKTFYPDILDGTAAGQIEAVWRYLASSKPRPPVGASANPIELVPTDHPILYRNFIEGAGNRAICVGFPEQVHVAWDAEAMRLALAWRGGFIDAGRHWAGRGQGAQAPLGDGVFTPDAAAAIAVLESPESSWPAAGPHEKPEAWGQGGLLFHGYALDARGRPTFRWSSAGMRIAEKIEPGMEVVDGMDGMKKIVRRTIRLEGRPAAGEAFFRVAVAAQVEETGNGWLRIDRTWRVRVSGAGVGPAANRTADGKTEIRRPIVWSPEGMAEFVEELSW